VILGVAGPRPLWEAVLLPAGLGAIAALTTVLPSPTSRATAASLGLIAGTFVAIELSGSSMSWHIHLYAILIFVALYQMWSPLIWAVVAVVVHHGVLGLIAPERVFGMHAMTVPAALGQVALHACLAAVEVTGIIVFWHFAEQAEHENDLLGEQAEQARQQADALERNAHERAATDLRTRSEESSQRAHRITEDVAVISAEAHAAITAVAAVDRELGDLTTSVQDIAARSGQAATTAADGKQAATSASEKVHRLERSVAEIAEVNALIASLADQTNLLALNATIEAARAGEIGKGFAVVASEVKDLAQETASSVERVKQVINAIVMETTDVATTFATTSGAVSDIHELQISIAASVEEQAAVLAEVTRQLSTATASANQVLTGLDRLATTG
jgi:methyl-accepting chemotaxis protein